MIDTGTQQLTEQWFEARCGIPSTSQFDRVFTTKLELSKQWKNYAYQLAGERITGIKTETFQSAAMLRGTETEPEARQLYELVTGHTVEESGFILHDSGLFGCSPDGLVEPEGAIEIKCPLAHTHIGYLLEGKLPTEYHQQCHGTLAVTGRSWIDFISYFPGLPLFIHRVEADPETTARIIGHLSWFAGQVTEVEARLRGMQ